VTGVLINLPLPEAFALLKRLDERESLTAADCAAVERATERLRGAVAGGEGFPTANETLAEALVGEQVRVETIYGKTFEGTLEKITGFRSIIVSDEPFSHPVNLSLVRSIQAAEQKVMA
jgi:hypothetical protein